MDHCIRWPIPSLVHMSLVHFHLLPQLLDPFRGRWVRREKFRDVHAATGLDPLQDLEELDERLDAEPVLPQEADRERIGLALTSPPPRP